MSELEKMYNWNGNYKLLKPLKKTSFIVSSGSYPEFLRLMTNEDGMLRYSIIDDNFGYPALANTMNTPHSVKLRTNSIKILNQLELDGYIEKIS